METEKMVELLRKRALEGRMEVRDKQLMLEAADRLENESRKRREIFEDLENFIPQLRYCGFGYTAMAHKLAELKKKYTEEKTDG